MISLNLHDKNINCQRTLKSYLTPSNKIYLSSFSPPVPMLGLDDLEIKSPVHNDVCSRMFTATLFVLEKMRNNLNVYKLNRKNVIYVYYDNYTAVIGNELDRFP